MPETVYISEPNAIDPELVASLLPDNYVIERGDTSFACDKPEACMALLIRSGTTVTSDIKSHFPNLKHVIRVGVGVDNIDTDYCKANDIKVYNAPGANSDAVSDYVVAMMFVALRNIYKLTRQDAETWNRFKFTGHSMGGRSIGIIGFGHIGRQIFTKLQGFACQSFLVYDPFVKKEDLPEGATYAASIEEVLQNSDIVTLHLPLLPETKYIVSKQNLELMKPGAILLNAARGGIVNEADVIEVCKSKPLIYVADTVENEPHVSGDLLDQENIIVTPHIASLTEEAEINMVKVAIANFLSNKPMAL